MNKLIKMIVIISSLTSAMSFAEGVKPRPSFINKDKIKNINIKNAFVDNETSLGTNENKLVAEFARKQVVSLFSYVKSVHRSKEEISVIVMIVNQKCTVKVDNSELLINSINCVAYK